MSSLLEAANTEPNKIEVINKLPKRVGDVSIMTIESLYFSLSEIEDTEGVCFSFDSLNSCDNARYYAYVIAGRGNSTAENLQAIGLDWYKQFKIPDNHECCLFVESYKVLGGPLHSVCVNNGYLLDLWCQVCRDNSKYNSHLYKDVEFSAYVAVVRAHE